MLIVGIVFLAIALLVTVFKCTVVWDATHEWQNGGIPTLDLVIVYPIFLAFGLSIILDELDRLPFPGFGVLAYLGFAVFLGFLHWLFDRHGKIAIERRMHAKEKSNSELQTKNHTPPSIQ